MILYRTTWTNEMGSHENVSCYTCADATRARVRCNVSLRGDITREEAGRGTCSHCEDRKALDARTDRRLGL